MAVNALNGLNIDIKEVNQKTVTQSIDAMVKSDPSLAWLKDAEARGDVDWRQVKEIHDSFKYSNSGLGPASQLIIAIAMATFVGPWAMTAAGGGGTVVAAAAGAVATGAATNAAVSSINNRGNLGAVLKDVTSSDAVKGYAVSAITAGLTAQFFNGLTGTRTDPLTHKIVVDLSSIENIGRFAATQVLQNGTSAALSRALGMKASFKDALVTSLLNTVAAASFDAAGGLKLADGSAEKIALHGVIGGILAEASGGDFVAGAVAAGVNEALATQLRREITQLAPAQRDLLLTSASQLVGLLSAALVDSDAKSIAAGAWIAKNATQYNFLNHYEMVDFVGDMKACAGDDSCYKNNWTAKYGNTTYDQLSKDDLADALETVGPARAKALMGEVAGGLAALGELDCPTAACESYKYILIGRAITAREQLQQIYVQGEGIVAGVLIAPATVVGGMLKGGEATEAAGVEKAYAFWADVRATQGAKGAGTLANAERGTLTEANFAQNKIKSDRSFSEEGQKVYSELAGTPIKTVDDLAGALRAGAIKPNQLPVNYVDMNGTRLILNTRTSTALEQAAIPRSEWFGRNQTGVEAYPGKTFNDLAADQLKNNKLPPTGAEQLKAVRP